MNNSVTRRFKWDDIEAFPGNPLLETRLSQMEKRWGGYIPQVVGIPLVADNAGGAFPEYDADAIIMVDGHHRMALAKRSGRGQEEVICELKRGETREALHRIFRQYNDNRSVNHAEKFLHRIGEGESKAVSILEVLEREGYCPTTTPGGVKDAIHSTGTLEWIWDGGDKGLRKRRGKGPHRGALTLTLTAYRALAPERFSKQSSLLKGLGAFYLRYPDLDSDRLISRLQEQYGGNADKLLSAAKQAKTDFHLPNNYEAFGFMARLAYNGHRGGKHTLPEWRS